MYGWLWTHLPGRLPAKLVASTVLLLGALALLFLVIFPWAEPHLPFNDVTVTPGNSTGSPTPSP